MFNRLESCLYDLSIILTGHKHYYSLFFSQSDLQVGSGKILDAGCGSGLLSVAFLDEYVNKRGISAVVHAFDISTPMLELAEKNAVKKSVEDNLRLYLADSKDLSDVTELGDCRKIRFEDGSFDLVMSSGMLEYTPSPDDAIYEMMRVLKPEGQLVLSFVNDNILGRSLGRLWGFRVLSEEYLFREFSGIKDFREFSVDSYNCYMKFLKSILIGDKS